MRIYIFILVSIFFSPLAHGQTANELYKAGDSLYKAKDYRNAAIAYGKGIREEGENAAINRYRVAASSWALAGDTDSAFHYLNVITQSDKANRTLARNIEYDPEFSALKSDKKWLPILQKIQKQAEKNGYPQEEFIYGRKDGIGLTLVCIKPKVKPNGKAIISVQSGGWVSGYNGIEINTQWMEQYLNKGFTVFAVMHGSSPRYAIPDAVNDLKRAVRYIRYNAGKFGIDPDRIGITGGSAGGHLSLMMATADESANPVAMDPVDRTSSRIQAVAVLYPPTDLLNWGGTGFNMVNAKQILLQRKSWGAVNFTAWNENTRLYVEVTDTAARSRIGREISPVYFVSPDDPPVFIIHGDADPTVPLQQSQSIIARFKEAGIINQFIIKKGGKHNPDDMNPEWLQFADWFERHLK